MKELDLLEEPDAGTWLAVTPESADGVNLLKDTRSLQLLVKTITTFWFSQNTIGVPPAPRVLPSHF